MSLIRRVIFLFCLIYVKRADVSPILPTFHMTVSYLVAQKIRLKTYQTMQYWSKCAKNIMENVLLIFFCIRFLYSGLNFIISWPWPNLDGFFVCLLDRTWSTQCPDKREQNNSISICLLLVLTNQKREISFQMGYNTIWLNWKQQISHSFRSCFPRNSVLKWRHNHFVTRTL